MCDSDGLKLLIAVFGVYGELFGVRGVAMNMSDRDNVYENVTNMAQAMGHVCKYSKKRYGHNAYENLLW